MFYLEDTAPNFSFPLDKIRLTIDKVKLLLFLEKGSVPYDYDRGIDIRKTLFENISESEIEEKISSELSKYNIKLIKLNFSNHTLFLEIEINKDRFTLEIPM